MGMCPVVSFHRPSFHHQSALDQMPLSSNCEWESEKRRKVCKNIPFYVVSHRKHITTTGAKSLTLEKSEVAIDTIEHSRLIRGKFLLNCIVKSIAARPLVFTGGLL